MLDYYLILGITSTASPKEIVAAYRTKCKLLHPDVNPRADATAQMQLVNEAYQVLSDSILRRQYDAQYGYSSKGGADSSTDYAQEFYNTTWWYQTYRQPSWYEHPIDDWYAKHKYDKKIHIPRWFWYVVYGLFLGIVIVRIVIPVIWGIIELFKILVY